MRDFSIRCDTCVLYLASRFFWPVLGGPERLILSALSLSLRLLLLTNLSSI